MPKGLQKRKLGRTNEYITFLGFGALEIGRNWGLGTGVEIQRPEPEEAGLLLNGILDLGINVIDTASAYHQSESRIGASISSRRKEYFLASKCGEHTDEPKTYYNFSYQAVKESIDRSLIKLNTDCIDLMQIHFGPEPQKVIDDGETVAAMKAAQQDGKIRWLGASTSGEIARQCIESGEFDVLQLDYSILNRTDEELVALCGAKNLGVIIRGGLAYGRLTPRVISHLNEDLRDKDKILKLLELLHGDANQLTAIALQFLFSNPHITSVLAGTKRLEHVKQNLERLDLVIPKEIMHTAIEISR